MPGGSERPSVWRRWGAFDGREFGVADGSGQSWDAGEQLARDFAVLARALEAEDGAQLTLHLMCTLAVRAIIGAEHAGLTVVRGKHFATPAASDAVAPMVAGIEYETGEGPCLAAIRAEQTVQSPDLSVETRWPQFCARVTAETKVRSMLCYRLFLQGDTLGALNLYSTEVDAFSGAADRALGEVFAAHAAVAMRAAAEHDHVAHLERALDSNRRIGAATGIIMCRHDLTEDAAFARLRTVSQRSNRKLRDVADDVVMTGRLDE